MERRSSTPYTEIQDTWAFDHNSTPQDAGLYSPGPSPAVRANVFWHDSRSEDSETETSSARVTFPEPKRRRVEPIITLSTPVGRRQSAAIDLRSPNFAPRLRTAVPVSTAQSREFSSLVSGKLATIAHSI